MSNESYYHKMVVYFSGYRVDSRRQKAIEQSISFAFFLQQLLRAFLDVLFYVASVLLHHVHD